MFVRMSYELLNSKKKNEVASRMKSCLDRNVIESVVGKKMNKQTKYCKSKNRLRVNRNLKEAKNLVQLLYFVCIHEVAVSWFGCCS